MGNRTSVSVFPTPGTARISSMTLDLRSSNEDSSRMANRSQVPKIPQTSFTPDIFSRSFLTVCRTWRCSFGKTSIKIIALVGLVCSPFFFLDFCIISIKHGVLCVSY